MILSYARTILLYLILILVIRLMGKRQIGQMEPAEFVVTMLVANLAAIPMQDGGIPLFSGLVPILTVLGMELVFSCLILRSVLFRKLFCGKPVILMEDGKILHSSLKQTRLTPDELTEHLRENGVLDLSTVKYAILETNGQVSVVRDAVYEPPSAKDLGIKPSSPELPITIISSGKLMKDNLRISGYTENWLHDILQKNNCSVRQVLLLTVDASGIVYLSLK